MHSLQAPPPPSAAVSPPPVRWSGASTIVLARYLESIDATETAALRAVAEGTEEEAAGGLAALAASHGGPTTDALGSLPRAAHTTVGVAVAVLSANEEGSDPLVLVIQEKHGPARGIWKLPGGSVDPGEDWQDAALREVREETGVSLTPTLNPTSLGGFRVVHNNSGTSNVYAVFGATVTPEQRRQLSLQPQAEEIARVAWLPVEQVAAQAPHMRDPESVYGALFRAAVQAATLSQSAVPAVLRSMRAARTSRAPDRPLGNNETFTLAKL